MALLSVALGGLLALSSEAGRRPGTAEPVDVVIVGAGWAGGVRRSGRMPSGADAETQGTWAACTSARWGKVVAIVLRA